MQSSTDFWGCKNGGLIRLVVWALKEEWRLFFSSAFFPLFRMGRYVSCIDEKAHNLMTWELGSHEKFSIAWCLIGNSCGYEAGYASYDLFGEMAFSDYFRISIIQHKKFRTAPDEEAYCTLLTALCENGNIEEAKEFIFLRSSSPEN